jgi:hypothetical protein
MIVTYEIGKECVADIQTKKKKHSWNQRKVKMALRPTLLGRLSSESRKSFGCPGYHIVVIGIAGLLLTVH